MPIFVWHFAGDGGGALLTTNRLLAYSQRESAKAHGRVIMDDRVDALFASTLRLGTGPPVPSQPLLNLQLAGMPKVVASEAQRSQRVVLLQHVGQGPRSLFPNLVVGQIERRQRVVLLQHLGQGPRSLFRNLVVGQIERRHRVVLLQRLGRARAPSHQVPGQIQRSHRVVLLQCFGNRLRVVVTKCKA